MEQSRRVQVYLVALRVKSSLGDYGKVLDGCETQPTPL